jgi:hypothetical protein
VWQLEPKKHAPKNVCYQNTILFIFFCSSINHLFFHLFFLLFKDIATPCKHTKEHCVVNKIANTFFCVFANTTLLQPMFVATTTLLQGQPKPSIFMGEKQ